MRRHALTAAMVAGLALCAAPKSAEEMTDEERKTPPPPAREPESRQVRRARERRERKAQ